MTIILKSLTMQAMGPCLECHLNEETVVCADAHLSHESLAATLNFELKELVTSVRLHIREGVFHIQHVSWHSHLKQWIKGTFHGIATRYLKHYLGWRRILTESVSLTRQGLEDKIAARWQYQQVNTTCKQQIYSFLVVYMMNYQQLPLKNYTFIVFFCYIFPVRNSPLISFVV